MPGYPNVVIKDSIRINAEFNVGLTAIEEAKEELGLEALVNDPELEKLREKFAALCYPFMKGFQEINAEFDAWFKKKLKPKP